ncbi:GyrI-like domain-containing protein [Stigmatella sp. ncwal1]|uniref:GyrI-like domain-containing protein n=1 Tax=Stigmatella ashevillensis TaxID=2995309 RepID=A0ABT5DN08_9BACT|nr:GyrI-like domain-containing protein [Stigmatella ashevillena]MDC0714523.1 GyrI-like domain-containing protein [Stigmatella ashevillena]
MLTLPKIIERPALPYLYVTFTVPMNQMNRPAIEGFPQIFAHIEKHGLKPVGAPFYNYRRINMEETLDVEAGIALETTGPTEGALKTGTLPAGRFMSLTWHGHPDELITVTGMMIGWAQLTHQDFDMVEKPDGDHFACRLELYESNPKEVPNMNEWVTTLAFKLKA